MIKRYKNDGKSVMTVSMIVFGIPAITIAILATIGRDWIFLFVSGVALLLGYLFGSIPRLLRLQDNDGTLEAIMPWKKLRMPIKDITRIRRGAGVGPYGEIWIEGKDDQENDTDAMRLGMMNFGYVAMREILLDLRTKNSRIQFDKYTEKIMNMKV